MKKTINDFRTSFEYEVLKKRGDAESGGVIFMAGAISMFELFKEQINELETIEDFIKENTDIFEDFNKYIEEKANNET